MASRAVQLKEEGNKRFQEGDYKGAEELYTKAIQKDASNPFLFTNRAFSRIKLQYWEGVLNDSLKSIELLPQNMKAYYYLAQAQLALKHPNEALNSALTAYDAAIKSNSSSAGNISSLVLRAKKEKWERSERERIARSNELLTELEEGLNTKKEEEIRGLEEQVATGEIGPAQAEEERQYAEESWRNKIETLRSAFAAADPDQSTHREVPDYLIDDITFAVMHDPVVTKTGHSYERSAILEHLKRSPTDPLTREPLVIDDLRPNLALREACAEFLEKNGWAVDW
ncbi:U-box-domain-containing protein [Xylona heveae TC161]|uniref:E3 ubiquitin-protein ligase CHIP n=1 Tax=Xylona heveae (strain CBS 132557 / TC161) TaxID=1328760 RepID=A0A165ISS0_XYLHT|nr:U-box-domain-containing protein [Xylona heveae TC161]KZF25332.1 U-box-domain-containing protein [Xylona heveae TC161]